MNSRLFAYGYRYAGKTDIGCRRSTNQDRVILNPETAFFGVSDGMGGLLYGEDTAEYVEKAVPALLERTAEEYGNALNAERAAKELSGNMNLISDCLYERENADGHFRYGATVAGAWLIGKQAVFGWLGDSRGYLLPKYKKTLIPVTKDMNIAALLLSNGLITEKEAENHPGKSQLTAFIGMQKPAETAVKSVEVRPGDRILLCSDGLYGLLDDRKIARILRSSRSPERVCERLVEAAKKAGGTDNISAVYIRIV